jgi:hypothetical protein
MGQNPNEIRMKRITDHFEFRLNERFGFEISTLEKLLKKPKMINSNSEELRNYPHLKNTFIKYPKCTLVIEESLNMCIATEGGVLITCYSLN